MTPRESLTRQMRRWSMVPALGIAASAATLLTLPPDNSLHPLWVVPFTLGAAAFVFGILAFQFRVRCPRCSGALGRIASQFIGAPFVFSKRIRFCAYCGLDLDAPLDGPSAGHQA